MFSRCCCCCCYHCYRCCCWLGSSFHWEMVQTQKHHTYNHISYAVYSIYSCHFPLKATIFHKLAHSPCARLCVCSCVCVERKCRSVAWHFVSWLLSIIGYRQVVENSLTHSRLASTCQPPVRSHYRHILLSIFSFNSVLSHSCYNLIMILCVYVHPKGQMNWIICVVFCLTFIAFMDNMLVLFIVIGNDKCRHFCFTCLVGRSLEFVCDLGDFLSYSLNGVISMLAYR